MAEELYKDFYEKLRYFCLSLSHDPHTAEDLVQETFLRALRHLEELGDLSHAQRRSWLCKTAKNLYIDLLRQRSREDSGGEGALPDRSVEEDFTVLAVRQLIDHLPQEERTLFELRYFQGYNSTELGELFALPPATVRARLSSARRRLKQWIGN
ncbi:MAG: RNA polymerase sigma factor [Oscillospiraceae bacterium]|nr:RNA polymerase sigma factor [Oscillospiraceae bacterium]